MPKKRERKKERNESAKEALARVARELNKPRVVASVREKPVKARPATATNREIIWDIQNQGGPSRERARVFHPSGTLADNTLAKITIYF
jgi:hypothetical protein